MWTPPERIKHRLPVVSWPTAAEAAKSLLFSPVSIGSLTARERTWVPAMVPWRATEEGFATDDVIDWYARFAAGRPGVLVVEATGIRDVPSGPLLRIGHDRFLPGLRRLVQAVRDASGGETLLMIQLIDFLAVRRRPARDKYFASYLKISADHRDRLAALQGDLHWHQAAESEVRAALLALDELELAGVLSPRELEALEFGYRERVTDVALPHVRDLPQSLPGLFADASARAFEAGFDGVELHYAHAYTMASFLSRTNDRSDGYGGSPEGRLRLPLEVFREVRRRVGPKRVVGARFLSDEVIPGGSHLEEALAYSVAFAREGFDFLSLSRGGKFDDAKQPKVGWAVYPYTGPSGYACMPTVISDAQGPFGRNVPLSAAVRRAVQAAGFATPIVAAGGIGTFAQAESILQAGEADIIGAARASLADPDWFLKARLGFGDQVRRCEYTNYCEALDQLHEHVTCKLWDRLDRTAPGVKLDPTGKRRLVPPPWHPPTATSPE